MDQKIAQISLVVRDYRAWQTAGVHFIEEPREETFGTAVIFEDLYGNKFDLVQRRTATNV